MVMSFSSAFFNADAEQKTDQCESSLRGYVFFNMFFEMLTSFYFWGKKKSFQEMYLVVVLDVIILQNTDLRITTDIIYNTADFLFLYFII